MQYLLMIYADEKAYAARPAEDQKRGFEAYMAYAEALKKSGAFLGAYGVAIGLERDPAVRRFLQAQLAGT